MSAPSHSVPESKIVAAIEHYKNSIQKHEHNKDKILYYMSKLAKFPMTVSILQKTLVGHQINALRKYEGDVGDAAKILVTRWKEIVRRESEGDHSDDELEEDEEDVGSHNHHSDDSGVDNGIEDGDRDDSDEKLEHDVSDKYSDSNPKRSFENDENKSEKRKEAEKHNLSSKKHKSEDKHRSNHESSRRSSIESSSKKTSHGSTKSRHHSKKSSHDSSSRKSKHESRKRKHHSDESDSDSDSDNSDSSESTRSSKRPKIKSEKRDSSEKDSESDSCSSSSDASDRKKSRDKREKSTKNKSSSNHHSSLSKNKSSSSHKKTDEMKKSSDSKSSSHKPSHSNDRRKDKEQDKSSSKDKHSKNSDHHKKSVKTDIKIKVEKDDSKPSKSGKDSQKSQSPVKVKQEKDTTPANSFEAALMGFSSPAETSKVKVKSKAGPGKATSSKSHSSESKAAKSPAASPSQFDLFPEVKSDLDKDIASSLPELADVYRPLPPVLENKRERPKFMSEDEALASIMTTKNQRTKVYSGNKASYTTVPSLFELCTRVLIENIDLLEFTGGVPYDILKPVIERATPDQLFTLEFHNEYLKEDTDVHWEFHCQKDFRNKTKQEDETWRDLYVRCLEERQQKFDRLTNNITRNIAESTPVRKTKLAYLDSAVKPPRNVIRKQAKHGTGSSSTPSSSKHEIIAKSVKGETSAAKPSQAPVKVTSPSMQRANNFVNNLIKKKKAPLMQKTLQFIKGNRFKR